VKPRKPNHLAPRCLLLSGWPCTKLNKYVKDGQPKKAMHLFQQMQQEGSSTNEFTFVLVIDAYTGL